MVTNPLWLLLFVPLSSLQRERPVYLASLETLTAEIEFGVSKEEKKREADEEEEDEEEEEPIVSVPPVDIKQIGELLAVALDQTNEPRPKGRGMIWEEFRTPPKFGCEMEFGLSDGEAEKEAIALEESSGEELIASAPEESEEEEEIAEASPIDVKKAGEELAAALDQTEFFEIDSEDFDKTLIREAEKKAQEKTAEQPSSIVAMVPVETEPVEELSFFEIEFGSTKETSRKEARLAAAEKKAESLEVFELNEEPVESALAS
ncbi:MAG: hypothetical protein KGJ02_07935, partial [Verrucomicrobiota bacterium]|nr:hypothetical protein [Verrucomicrobiota bacterium]